MTPEDTYHIRTRGGAGTSCTHSPSSRCTKMAPGDMVYGVMWYIQFEDTSKEGWEWCPECVAKISPLELLAEIDI